MQRNFGVPVMRGRTEVAEPLRWACADDCTHPGHRHAEDAARISTAYLPAHEPEPLTWGWCIAVWTFVLIPVWLGIIAALRWWLS